MNKGFTLIELMVVVFIIGILAVIALPQYQTALLKSRLGAAIPVATAIKLGAEMDYAENRTVTDSTKDLAINPPANCGTDSVGKVVCPNMFIDLLTTGVVGNGTNADVLVLVPTKNTAEVGYRVFLNIPPNEVAGVAGKRECWAEKNNRRAENVCKSLSGKLAPTGSASYSKSWDVYGM